MSLIDWIKGIFKSKEAQPYEFSDEDRELSAVRRLQNSITKEKLKGMRQKLEHLRRIQTERQIREETEMLEAELYEDDEEDAPVEMSTGSKIDDLFIDLLRSAMKSKGQPGQQEGETVSVELSRAQIKSYLSRVPKKQLDFLLKLKKKEQKQAIVEQFPQLTEDTVDRVIEVLNE